MKDLVLEEVIKKVAAEAGVSLKVSDDDHNQLIDDYNALFDELASTDLLLKAARSSNVDLVHELNEAKTEAARRDHEICVLNDKLIAANKKIAQAAQDQSATKSHDKDMAAANRRIQVLEKDLKKSQEQVKRAKSAKPKQAKPVKIAGGVAKLQQDNKRLNKYISELLKWGQISPQYTETMNHSSQGRLDIIDLKSEDSDVSDVGSVDKEVKSCHRFIVINSYNDMKMVAIVKDEEGMHNPIAPYSMKLTVDDEIREFIFEHVKKSDVINKQVLASIKSYD